MYSGDRVVGLSLDVSSRVELYTYCCHLMAMGCIVGTVTLGSAIETRFCCRIGAWGSVGVAAVVVTIGGWACACAVLLPSPSLLLTSKLLNAPNHLASSFSLLAQKRKFFSSEMTCMQYCLLLLTLSMSTASMMLSNGTMRWAEYSSAFL